MTGTHADIDAASTEAARPGRATQQGISLSEYLRRLIAQDLGPPDISILFDLATLVSRTNIGRDKDKMLGEAVWKEHLRKTGRRVPRKRG